MQRQTRAVFIDMKDKATSDNFVQYTHAALDEHIVAIGGHFQITKEKRTAYRGKALLYLLGLAHMDNACCGAWGCCYAIVKGYIEDWKYKKDRNGYAITRLTPITDSDDQEKIRKTIMSDEMVQQVIFT